MASRVPLLGLIGLALAGGCGRGAPESVRPAVDAADAPATFWNSATVYFLLTDRFANGDSTNDHALGRASDAAVLRGFEGGDLAGILRKIEEGYFDSLGVHAIWLTPFVEQLHAAVDEGTGRTYGYHGYWARDWTTVDRALGTVEDLRRVVDAAHRHGIRVLMDAVINHPGGPTVEDPAWPSAWVRTEPNCSYKDYATTVDCTLVRTLPDIRTESDEPVELPPALVEKWEREGRRAAEEAELDAYFERTGHPRAPRYYLIKWLTDWVRELGFDGYRVDTAKHFGESVSAELREEAAAALGEWRRRHPGALRDTLPFYMVGEVYNWEPGRTRAYDFGDREVDYFEFGYDALINFGFKRAAAGAMDSLFRVYSTTLHAGPMRGNALLNYLSSHDDGSPYDAERRDPFGAGTRLLLAPGGAQIYYGDELARPLKVAGAEGDANLRSSMNWGDLERGGRTAEVLEHWRKLGRFRREHPSVGAGVHRAHQERPYVFSRSLDRGGNTDRVLVAMDLPAGEKEVPVFGVFGEGVEVVDEYSGVRGRVQGGRVRMVSGFGIVLLGEAR